jgi:hypothetical protein
MEIAFMIYFDTEEQAVAAAELAADESWDHVEFNGMNCNDWLSEGADECPGWDGVSRRCSCGNRRVYWATSQNADGKWSAYAEAY